MRQLISKAFFSIFLALMASSGLLGQSSILEDSLQIKEETLSYFSYMNLVGNFHPVARQARLITDEAEAKLLKSRGGFDPKLYGKYNDKDYDGSNYWDIGEVGIKIPTRFGVEIEGTYEWNDGDFLNPERNIPAQGQGALGIMVPIGNGAFIDQRRAALAQAKIYLNIGQAERVLLLNDLLMEAGSAYWNWVAIYQLRNQFQEAADRAKVRLDIIKNAFSQGDRAVYDTLDAYSQWQSFRVQLIETQAKYRKATLDLSNYLWSENGYPLALPPSIEPNPLPDSSIYPANLDLLLRERRLNLDDHPILQSKIYKIEYLDIDRRLSAEALKPEINLKYNLLTGKGATFFNQTQAESDTRFDLQPQENFKIGVELNFPIFLRKARGDLQVSKIAIQEEQLSLDFKRVELQNKISAQQRMLEGFRDQAFGQMDVVKNLRAILELEETKLRAGESNLFLINSREQKLIKGQQKLTELLEKYQMAELELLWVSAILVELGERE